MTFTIYRRHKDKAGPHFNSPLRDRWSAAGSIRAASPSKAFQLALRVTGAHPDNIHINQSGTDAEDANALGFLRGWVSFMRRRK